ncbi:hypothetical protein [Gaiella sp.]|uniref:hypothetical protein n=1 Tax=Gaiella sp. TaxID=2663207 RepID=UPI002E35758D|nr:hypothetical protein [Gaiella sp.]HEX5583264.1 hypothetical protein [Gaiella sp.]
MTTVAIRGEERELALSEVEAVRSALPEGEYRERLDSMHAALSGGEVEDRDTDELERLVILALQSGRARALYGPSGEQALLRLYRRLPGGVEVKENAAAVTEALGQLRGKLLEQIDLTAVGPGLHSLTLEAGGLRLLVHLDRNGARLASVETSG